MSIFQDSLELIERGKQGLNKGLPMGFERLVQYLPNIQQGTYYLVGASTKVGKTSFVDDVFMYNPFDYVNGENPEEYILDIDYFSFEIEKRVKIIKGIARRIFWTTGLSLDVNYILSKGKNRISEEHYQLVRNQQPYFEKLEDILHIHDIPENPTGMYKTLRKKCLDHHTIEYENYETTDEQGNPITKQKVKSYKKKNEKRYHLSIYDHAALAHLERNFTLKQNIDKISQYNVELRNSFDHIPVVIQQMSFDSESSDRKKTQSFKPTKGDFGDSRYTTRDANVILALYNPSEYGVTKENGYDIAKLGNYFRNLEILNNRDGEPNINIGLYFNGKVGTFKELPRTDDLEGMKKLYEYIKTLE